MQVTVKLLEITNAINTKLLPCIKQANRKIEGTIDGLDVFWRNRSKNKYLKGKKREGGVGINVEALERELSKKTTLKHFEKGTHNK